MSYTSPGRTAQGEEEQVSSICRKVSRLDFGDIMSKPEQARNDLRKEVIEVLTEHPKGVTVTEIWELVSKKFKHIVKAKAYGVSKMKLLFALWPEIETFTVPRKKEKMIRLKKPAADVQPRPQTSASKVEDLLQSRLSFSEASLKKDVMFALNKNPSGVIKSEIWATVYKMTGRKVNLLDYGYGSPDQILAAWSNDIEEFRDSTGELSLRIRQGQTGSVNGGSKITTMTQGGGASYSGEVPQWGGASQSHPQHTAMDVIKRAGQQVHAVDAEEEEDDEEDEYDNEESETESNKIPIRINTIEGLLPEMEKIKAFLVKFINNKQKSVKKKSLRHTTNALRDYLKIKGMIVKDSVVMDLVKNKLHDDFDYVMVRGILQLALKPTYVDSRAHNKSGLSAMELMKHAQKASDEKSKVGQTPLIDLTKPGLDISNESKDFISLDGQSHQSQKTAEVIDLTESDEQDEKKTALNPVMFQGSLFGPGQRVNPLQLPVTQHFFQGARGFNPQHTALLGPTPGYVNIRPFQPVAVSSMSSLGHVNINPIQSRPTLLGPALQFFNSTAGRSNQTSEQANKGPVEGQSALNSSAGMYDTWNTSSGKPVDCKQFDNKEIVVRPVYLARGERPQPAYVDNIAKECIEILADANKHVNMREVEDMLLKRFNYQHIGMLGFRYADQIPCVNELNRLLCKVNAYIMAFTRTRSICSLYELKEALREYAPNKSEFKELKLGPLQRLPVIFENFKFPPDLAEIPQISSMDVLDHFRDYLTKNNLWTNRLELEPFMNYLVTVYRAPDAYHLGVRIRSLPLAAAVLKKAQRDAGAQRRSILDHYKEELKTEIEDAFRKFRGNILQSDGAGMEVRRHYLKMRPDLAIPEIFEKFKLLMTIVDMNSSRERKLIKIIQEFVDQVTNDRLALNLLHLSVCMSNTALEEAALAIISKPDVIEVVDDDEETDTPAKPQPAKGDVVQSLTKYLERCLHSGSLSLPLLNKIEENLLSDYGYTAFSQIGYGRFLEFLLSEAKQLLEEAGGTSLGSASGSMGDSEVAYQPHLKDIFDFIKQCHQSGLTQHPEIEAALCRHYGVKEVRLLGNGHISRLMARYQKMQERRTHQPPDHVYYETAVAPTKGMVTSEMRVGALGHQTVDLAKACLHNCPLLENLAEWSQWHLVFEPELGKLKDFIHKYGGQTNKHLEGGRLATLDFLALEVAPGCLLKVVSNTSPELFVGALYAQDHVAVSGHLASMVVSFNGVANMPLALLASHMKTSLLQIHASDSPLPGGPMTESSAACHFVLGLLLRLPTQICVALANQVILEPLGQVVGSTTSKQQIAALCSSVQDLNKIVELGCKLGVTEWSSVMLEQKCRLPESSVQILPPDIEEFFDTSNQQQDEQESEDDDEDIDDDDEILAGDLKDEPPTRSSEVKQGQITKNIKLEQPTGANESADSRQDTAVKEEPESGDADLKTVETVTIETDSKEVADDQSQDEDEEVVMIEDVLPEEQRCLDIVNKIRKEEFGIGVKLSEDGEKLMQVQQARLGRSLDRLSKDLYSKDTHFVLELVQNADDNDYSDDLLNGVNGLCPSVKFVMDNEGITVLNNEQGFEEINIRALCDVGRSTKGKHKFGYIGQKGIGFKSVFRVTDDPEIHSNGFHIKFDVKSGPMGYILPHWVEPDTDTANSQWMTKIILRLKQDILQQTRTLASRFNDIHPSLLLFLHRLREITVENKVEQKVQTMRRKDIGDQVVEITHSQGRTERWLVVKRMLDASKVSSQAKSGVDVESTEIAMAFPLPPRGQPCSAQVLPQKQPVFAFLPLRSYGFRFIVQGDFDVPSSREDVDRDSSWNQWLRSEIHTLFLEALDVFKNHEEFTSIEAVCSFLQFVPMEDEVLDFFKPVATDILKKLRAKPCIPTQPNDQGVISWKLPSQTVRVRDPLVRSVVTSDLLLKHLNLSYLHPDVATLLNPTLTLCLGIETLTSDHLFQLGSALVVNMGTHCEAKDVILIAQWLACMYRSLDEYRENDTILKRLASLRMLPLSDGRLISREEMVVFFPITDKSQSSKKERDPLLHLQQDVNSLHPLLLNTDDAEVNSQVQKLLARIDVKQLAPKDVINSHIIPVLKSDQWKSKSSGTLMSYLVYIKEQTDKQPSLCNMEELREVAQVSTSNGCLNPSKSLVHFPLCYGNPTDLRQFPGNKWTLLSSDYLPTQCTPQQVNTWHAFFSKLGVEDFVSIKLRELHLTRADLAQCEWSAASEMWPLTEDEFVLEDWHSAEIDALIQHNLYPEGDIYHQQMRLLFEYLDKNWTNFSRYTVTKVMDKNKKQLKDVETSLSMMLKKNTWVPAVQCQSIFDEVQGTILQRKTAVLKKPNQVYIRLPGIERLLAQKVLYLNVQTTSSQFCDFIGLKHVVTIDTMKDLLCEWGRRDLSNPEPAQFSTSMAHIKHVYMFLSKELSNKEFQMLLREEPVIFVPDLQVHPNTGEMEVPGRFLNKSEVWMFDPTKLFSKYRRLLEQFHSDISRKRTINSYYQDNSEVLEHFRYVAKISQEPQIEEYLELLELLCSTSTPKETQILSDVLYIFSTLGHIISMIPEGMRSVQTAKMVLEDNRKKVRDRFQKHKVLPTKKQVWVSLDDCPFIPDHKQWEKLFEENAEVHFLDVDEKNSPKPSRGRRQGRQGYENRVDPDLIEALLDELAVPLLSESVESVPIPSVLEPCFKLQEYVHQIVPAIQQYLAATYEDLYDKLKQLNFKNMLADAKFYQTSSLEVRYSVTVKGQDVYVVQQEKCVVQPPNFFFHLEHLSSNLDINYEIARAFSNGNEECSRQLRSFLMELSNIVSRGTSNTVEDLLRQHDAHKVCIPPEEKWFVPPPPAPKVEPPKKPEPVKEPQSDRTQPGQSQEQQGPFELRMWPPVANDNRQQNVRRVEQGERPVSNIWPPPMPKDYMRSQSTVVRVLQADENDPQGSSQQNSQPSSQQNREAGPSQQGTRVVGPGLQQSGGNGLGTSSCRQEVMVAGDRTTDGQTLSVVSELTRKRKLSGDPSDSDNTVKRLSGDYSSANMEERPSGVIVEGQGQAGVTGQSQADKSGHVMNQGQSSSGTNIQQQLPNGSREIQEGQRLNQVKVIYNGGQGGHLENVVRSDVHAHGASNIRGDPIWSQMATDYTFDELACDRDLTLPDTVMLTEGASDSAVGLWGEALVAAYLQRQKDAGNIEDFSWKNNTLETGCPFDFEVHYTDENGVHTDYVEVKSTVSADKAVFEISVQQIKFATEKKGNFHIYRVFNAGDPERVKLIRIYDLYQRLSTKQVKLCMLI